MTFSPRTLRTAAGTATGLALLTGCSIWGPEGGPGGAGAAAPADGPTATTPVDATAGPDGIQRVQVSLTDKLTLEPSLVRARPGTIEFTFHNSGITPHDIVISTASPGPVISPGPAGVSGSGPGTGNLNGGQTATVRVTITAPGRYPYPCVYHITNGMQGILDVIVATTTGPGGTTGPG